MSDKLIVHRAQVLQIIPAPGRLADRDGNEYVGYALCEFEFEWPDGECEVVRDILPFGSEGGIFGAPGESYYELHGLGDDRPGFAHFFDVDGKPITPGETDL